jgi:hypothetical protein
MRKLIGIALIALLSFVSPAFGAIAVSDKDSDTESYIGEASQLCIEGQSVSFDGSKVTILANGHKDGVTANVSTESNLTSAALAYGVVYMTVGSSKYVNLASGTPGQMVTFILSAASGGTIYITDDKVSSTLQAATVTTGWDDLAFTEALDSITLLYVDDTYGWIIVGNNGVTVT